jgi:hypothetical protein
MFQPTAAQVVLEFTLHVLRQRALLLGHVGDERRVVLLDDCCLSDYFTAEFPDYFASDSAWILTLSPLVG